MIEANKNSKELGGNTHPESSQNNISQNVPQFEKPEAVTMNLQEGAPFSHKSGKSLGSNGTDKVEFILDIPLEITVELGRSKMSINELLKLGQGSVIELSKVAGENLEILANHKLIARGEVVAVNDNYGIRLTEIVPTTERIESLK